MSLEVSDLRRWVCLSRLVGDWALLLACVEILPAISESDRPAMDDGRDSNGKTIPGNPSPEAERAIGVGVGSTDTTDLIGKTRSSVVGLNGYEAPTIEPDPAALSPRDEGTSTESRPGSELWTEARLTCRGVMPRLCAAGRSGVCGVGSGWGFDDSGDGSDAFGAADPWCSSIERNLFSPTGRGFFLGETNDRTL